MNTLDILRANIRSVIHRCASTVPRRQIRAAWGFRDHHRLVGYVGRYSWEKNPVAAARVAAHFGGEYHAVYAGSGWMEAELRQHAAAVAGTPCGCPIRGEGGNDGGQ